MKKEFTLLMKEFRIGGFLIENPSNYYWLTGFDGEECFCCALPEKALLVVDSRFTEQARSQTENDDTVEVVEYATPTERDDIIANYFERADLRVLAYDGGYISHRRFEEYKKIFGRRYEFFDPKFFFPRLRRVKTKDEIAKIEKAAEIVDAVFDEVCGFIKPGVAEKQIAAEIDYRMRLHGADKPSFDTIVASGYRGALPHGKPEDKIVQNGEAVVMDFGAYYKGYCSDITRTVFVGTPDDESRKIYETVLKAQIAGVNGINPGVSLVEADANAREVIKDAGYGDCFGHSVGHGIGIDIHESPNVSPTAKGVLEEGNVVTVEPGIYIPGKIGVRIEDDVLVSKDGHRVLTKSDKKLIIL